ncbi:MAG: transketolase [Cellulosilyticum sp.]|nr:transketolase [Cellulosilyticum sp.]
MIFDKKNARFLSMLGHRGTFSIMMTELAEQMEHLIVMTADMGYLTGLEKFKKKYPEQFYNVGIAEQNMIGIASGLAKVGNIVFATTYANFITMRSYEQIRLNLGYMKFNVKIVGTGAGLSMGMSGNSHYGLEDVALMRAIPNMMVVSPADGIEIAKTLVAATEYEGPMYIRLSGTLNQPIIYREDYKFELGKAITLKEGRDITLIATGTMVYECLKAAEELESQEISVRVINMHTIKPLDTEIIDEALKETRLLVTVEEHSVIGGLSSAVAEYKSTKCTLVPQLKIGLPDQFGVVGEYKYLLEYYGLTARQIAQKVKARYELL